MTKVIYHTCFIRLPQHMYMPYTQLHIHMNLEKGVKQHIIGMEMGHDVDTGKNFCYLLQLPYHQYVAQCLSVHDKHWSHHSGRPEHYLLSVQAFLACLINHPQKQHQAHHSSLGSLQRLFQLKIKLFNIIISISSSISKPQVVSSQNKHKLCSCLFHSIRGLTPGGSKPIEKLQ